MSSSMQSDLEMQPTKHLTITETSYRGITNPSGLPFETISVSPNNIRAVSMIFECLPPYTLEEL